MRTIERKIESNGLDSFAFETDESPADFIVDWFSDWLENYVSNGAEISDGQTLQVGYTLVQCNVLGKSLRLQAPDFSSMPITWTPNMGPAFQIIGWHKYVPENFSFTPNIPTLQQTVIVGRDYDQLPMFGNRLAPTGTNDSGWFFGSTREDVDNNDPEQLNVISLYEALLSAPQMLPYLSMPTDCQIMFSSDKPEILQNFEPLEITAGSMVDLLLKSY